MLMKEIWEAFFDTCRSGLGPAMDYGKGWDGRVTMLSVLCVQIYLLDMGYLMGLFKLEWVGG